MKRNILFLVTLLVLAGMTMLQSCKEEEGVITSYGAFTQPTLVAPANDAWISVSGTTVSLQWSSSDSDGDPEKWDIYFGTSHDPDLVKAGHDAQNYTVTVAKGVEYFWRVVGTDSRGIPTRSDEWSFKVIDPAAVLTLDMMWDTDVESSIGISLDPDEVVDLRLLIVKESDKTIVLDVDEASFESTIALDTLPDNTYLIAADIYSTIDAGDFNAPVSVSINLNFEQPGVLSQTYSFPNVMTNVYPCEAYRTYMIKIVKNGKVYTITKALSYMAPEVISWQGTDAEYPSEVTTVAGCELTMEGLLFGWMLDWWGEIIIDGGTLIYTVESNGDVEIPYQYYCTTTWNGAVQTPYYIEGTGTLDESGAFPELTLHYDINQGGTWVGAYCFDNYGWTQDGFDAVITTDPAGKGGSKGRRPIAPKNLIKPIK